MLILSNKFLVLGFNKTNYCEWTFYSMYVVSILNSVYSVCVCVWFGTRPDDSGPNSLHRFFVTSLVLFPLVVH